MPDQSGTEKYRLAGNVVILGDMTSYLNMLKKGLQEKGSTALQIMEYVLAF